MTFILMTGFNIYWSIKLVHILIAYCRSIILFASTVGTEWVTFRLSPALNVAFDWETDVKWNYQPWNALCWCKRVLPVYLSLLYVLSIEDLEANFSKHSMMVVLDRPLFSTWASFDPTHRRKTKTIKNGRKVKNCLNEHMSRDLEGLCNVPVYIHFFTSWKFGGLLINMMIRKNQTI